MLKAENIYDCPISEQIGALQTMMAEEHEKMIFKAVQQIGIEIDQESLIQAINSDRKRYEAAYNKGYSDCEEHYKELIGDIMKRLSPVKDALESTFKKKKQESAAEENKI